jgi:hypothetical protein
MATDAREAETSDAAGPASWDPERVARHLERAVVQAYRAYRRTTWLRLLGDAEVTYREPGATCARTLRIRAGEIGGIDAPLRDDDSTAPSTAFDRARYDRLRILTTELKRILRDGGDAGVITQTGRRLEAARLRGILAVV